MLTEPILCLSYIMCIRPKLSLEEQSTKPPISLQQNSLFLLKAKKKKKKGISPKIGALSDSRCPQIAAGAAVPGHLPNRGSHRWLGSQNQQSG